MMKNINLKEILQNFQKFLPSPDNFSNILKKKINSLMIVDISSNLKIINVELKGEIKVNALKIVELSKDKKDEMIIESLGDFIKANDIQHKNTILIPPLNSLVIRRIQLPAVPEAELLEAIKWQIKKEVTFDLSRAVLGYQVIKETTKEDGAKILDVKCVIAEEEKLKKQVLLLKQIWLKCLAVIPLTFGYAKLMEWYLKDKKDKIIGIFALGEENSYFMIYREDKLNFYRELPICVNKLKESLTGTLVSDKGHIHLSTEEIEEILSKYGIPCSDFVYQNKISANQILAMLRPILERVAQEIKRSLIYYDSQFHEEVINEIFLTDEALRIPNLDNFLSKELSLKISPILATEKIKAGLEIDYRELLRSYPSISLACDFDKHINLLPWEFRTEKVENIEKIVLRWVILATFLFFLVSYIFARAIIGIYQRRLDNALVQLNVLSQVKYTKEKIDDLSNFTKRIKNLEPSVGVMLKKLSNTAPREIFINNFSLNADVKTGVIDGFVKSTSINPNTILTKFVSEMGGSGYFTDVSISSLENSSQQGEEGILRFNIAFRLP